MPKVTPLSQNSHLAIRCTSLLLRTSEPFAGTANILTEFLSKSKKNFQKSLLFLAGAVPGKVLRISGDSYIIKDIKLHKMNPGASLPGGGEVRAAAPPER